RVDRSHPDFRNRMPDGPREGLRRETADEAVAVRDVRADFVVEPAVFAGVADLRIEKDVGQPDGEGEQRNPGEALHTGSSERYNRSISSTSLVMLYAFTTDSRARRPISTRSASFVRSLASASAK